MFASPSSGSGFEEILCTDEFSNRTVVHSNYVLTYETKYFGGNECTQWGYSTFPPPPGCNNFWQRLQETGILYEEWPHVVPEPFWGVIGGWSLPAMAISVQ